MLRKIYRGRYMPFICVGGITGELIHSLGVSTGMKIGVLLFILVHLFWLKMNQL
ncbi:hypothetical protein AA0X95_16580 [Bacillus sp. 1P10SD]|uniref:hypothetical protein n=1 Tax=Bacillus sp. 1P10SD TaxID=3132265 RepID=UPI0039A508C9